MKLDADATIIVCARSTDGPPGIVASKRDRCADCRSDVYISPSSLRKRAATPSSVVLCLSCAERQMANDPTPVLLPRSADQEAELREHYLREGGWKF